MNKFFILLSLFFITKLNAQELEFDILAIYTKFSLEAPSNISVYAISNNNNYLMKVVNLPNDLQRATVFDIEKRVSHDFLINEMKNEKDSIVTEFKFERTDTIKNLHVVNNYDVNKVSSDGEIDNYNLKIFKNKSKKKIVNEFFIKSLKSETNFFNIFKYTCIDLNIEQNSNFKDFGLVTECYSIDNKYRFELKFFEEVNLKVNLPKKLEK